MEMDKEQYGRAKACFVSCMQEGQSWQRASASAGLQISQSNAYRLMNAVRQRGEAALSDGRHGHPSKLRGAARAFLEEQCRQAPQTPSSAIQALLRERFGLSVSISQINRVRATLGISKRLKSQQQEKKLQRGACFSSARVAGRCRQSSVTRRCSTNGLASFPGKSSLTKPPHC
jgi:transposase